MAGILLVVTAAPLIQGRGLARVGSNLLPVTNTLFSSKKILVFSDLSNYARKLHFDVEMDGFRQLLHFALICATFGTGATTGTFRTRFFR
jgi:hypothetical protein